MALNRDPLSGAIRENPKAIGPKRYGLNRSTTATSGPVDKTGYRERDRDALRRKAVAEKLNSLGGIK